MSHIFLSHVFESLPHIEDDPSYLLLRKRDSSLDSVFKRSISAEFRDDVTISFGKKSFDET